MEIKKKNRDPPTKIHWSEGALFELSFLQIQAELMSTALSNSTRANALVKFISQRR
jgi:hypothetical protein